MVAGIYGLHNTTKNIAYVGSSSDIHERLVMHDYLLRVGNHPNSEMQANHASGDEFVLACLYELDNTMSPDDYYVRMAVAEQMYIDSYSKVYNKHGAPILSALINKYLKIGIVNNCWEDDLASHIETVKAETGVQRIREEVTL